MYLQQTHLKVKMVEQDLLIQVLVVVELAEQLVLLKLEDLE
jgi:hypothetical protein|tara:strand:+ start:140 stop:262 length:123 start_codon:yes stop_codon:yes gene_type:complete